MRLSERNKSPIYYAVYDGTEKTTTTDGLYTGENPAKYKPVVLSYMVVGLASGSAMLEQFGINDSFSVKLATDDTDCPIDTSSVVWLGLPVLYPYNENRTYKDGDRVIKDGKIVERATEDKKEVWNEVPYTHAVVRASKSFGYITYLLKEVEVS